MHQFTFNTISYDEFTELLGFKNKAGKKHRQAALQRVQISLENTSPRKQHIVIPENTTQHLHITLPSSQLMVFEILQKPHSKLTLSCMSEKTGNKQHSLLMLSIFLEEGAQCTSTLTLLSEDSPAVFQNTRLLGKGASTKQQTVFFGTNNQQLDIFSTTELLGEETQATIAARGVLCDSASARFDGSIEVTKAAAGADAILQEQILLLSPTAKINAIPALKIANNNVRASHAASVTRIDDEHLFYLCSRGVDETTAKRLIVEGFLRELIPSCPEEKTMHTLLNKKLWKI